MQGTQERQTLSSGFLQNLGDFSFHFHDFKACYGEFHKILHARSDGHKDWPSV